jgi:hypothetical protein
MCKDKKLKKWKKCVHEDAIGKSQIYFANYAQSKSNILQNREKLWILVYQAGYQQPYISHAGQKTSRHHQDKSSKNTMNIVNESYSPMMAMTKEVIANELSWIQFKKYDRTQNIFKIVLTC